MADQDSNPLCSAMPSFPVLLQRLIVDCDTVLPDGDAAKGSDQPTVQTSTERPPSAASRPRQTPEAFMPLVETKTSEETTEWTVSGDSRTVEHIKFTKQVTEERDRSPSREKRITTTRTVKTITTVEKKTNEIEKIDREDEESSDIEKID